MNKKGFTLVELLAVIVLLAIIALIASPIILNLVGDSQEGALKSSVNGVKKAIEQDYGDSGFKTGIKYNYGGYVNGDTDPDTSTKTLIGDIGNIEREISLSGSIIGKGKGIITSEGTVKFVIFTENYCAAVGVVIITGKSANEIQIRKFDSSYTKANCITEINNVY